MNIPFSRRQIIASMGTLMSGTFLARALSAITLILTARLLGPDQFGQFAGSLALVRISAMVFSLGLDAWLLRMGGRHRERLGSFLTSALSLKTGLGLVWFLLLWLVAPWLKQDSFPWQIVLLLAGSVWCEEVTGTIANGFEAVLRNRSASLVLVGSQLALLLPTGWLAWQGESRVEPYLVMRLIAAASTTLFFALWQFRSFGWHFHLADIWLTLRQSRSYAASLVLANLTRQADVTIVAQFLGKTAAGQYAPAITVVSTLFLIPQVVFSVMLPVLSRAQEHHSERVKPLAQKLTWLMFGLGLLFTAGAFVVARPLMVLAFGPEYALTGDILRIFSFILVFRCLSFAFAALLTAVGWQSRRVVVQVIVVLLNIGLNLLVVTRWGLVGVAWVYVATEAVLALGHYYWVARWYRLKSPVIVAAADSAH